MKLLMVENHRVFAQTVAAQFLSAHQVTIVSSLAEARRAAGYDAALVDYDLDDGKGDAFVAELRARGFSGRVIAISSHDDGNAALMRAGADAVCSKMEFVRIGGFLPDALGREGHALMFPARGTGEDETGMFEVDGVMVAFVADGAGGTRGGKEAAMAVGAALRQVNAAALEAKTWAGALESVGSSQTAKDEGRTTAVVVATDGARVVGASVGDSEAWAVGANVRRLTEHQQRKPLLGEPGAIVTGFEAQLDGATLLLGTDGLFKYGSAEAIAEIVRRPSPLPVLSHALVELVRLRSGALNDDVGLVLLRDARTTALSGR